MKQIHVASARLFKANPKGKSPINTLQIRTFAVSDNFKCQLHFKICHYPSSKLMYFPFSLSIMGSMVKEIINHLKKQCLTLCTSINPMVALLILGRFYLSQYAYFNP